MSVEEDRQSPSSGPVIGAGGTSLLKLAAFLGLGAIVLIMGLVVALLVHRLGEMAQGDPGRNMPTTGVMPAGFDSDLSPEAGAFRATCSQCHVLPSPGLYDRAGWLTVRGKMAAQMAARGLVIPEQQIDLAIAYVIRHGRPSPGPPETRPN